MLRRPRTSRRDTIPPAHRSLARLVGALALTACGDATPPAAPAGAPADPHFARPPVQQVTPTGKGVGTRTTLKGQTRTRYPLQYHQGQVMQGGANVYFIWYGSWNSVDPTPGIVTDFASHLGGSPYFAINTLYYDANAGRPSSSVVFGGSIDDVYSRGAALSEADVAAIVVRALDNLQLPSDPSGIYVVLGSADVTAGTGLGSAYCALRNTTPYAGSDMKYAFIGNPERAPAACAAQTVGPNGTLAADAIVSLLANVLANSVTDPLLNAWYDQLGLEPADKCAWDYGPTYRAPNGARANVRLGARDYLLQQLWVPTGRSGCALAAPV